MTTMTTWQPQNQGLRTLVVLLQDLVHANPQNQCFLLQRLQLFDEYPDYNSYLMYILTTSSNNIKIRLAAGTQLSNNINSSFNKLPLDSLKYVKNACIQHLQDEQISNVVSCLAAAIVKRGQVHNWPQIMPLLINELPASIQTIDMICQDVAIELEMYLLDLIPKLAQLYDSDMRSQAIHATSQFVILKQPAFTSQLDLILSKLYATTIKDSNIELNKITTSLLEIYPRELEPYLETILDYMITAVESDQDDSVILTACDFWSQFGVLGLYSQHLTPLIKKLVVNLLNLMLYEEIQEDDDDDGDDIEDDQFYEKESKRQSSAIALDILSINFGNIVTVLLEHLLGTTLHHKNWLVRESGILALGAIASEDNIATISQHAAVIIPYLLNAMQDDTQPLIRSISCWAISRFSAWLVTQAYFGQVLLALVHQLLDTDSRVQESACTALITLQESSGQHQLVSYIYPILHHTRRAFVLYNRKNRLMLYEALGTLADCVGDQLNRPQFIALLMPPLISKWNQLSDNDTDLFPLLKCLSNITAALGPGFIQYVDPVLSRCIKLISSTLQDQIIAEEQGLPPPNVEFLVDALDLLSGMVRGLDVKMEPFIAHTPLLTLLNQCIHDPVEEVIQATFMLLGDIARSSFTLLEPYLHTLIYEMIQLLQQPHDSYSVYNNVLWALGELVMRWSTSEVQPYVPAFMHVLVPLLTTRQLPCSIHENAMLAIGRLGLVCPQLVAPYLAWFIKPWLKQSVSVREGEEKDEAFRGLCAIIKFNAQVAYKEPQLLLIALSTVKHPSEGLLVQLNDVVKASYHHGVANVEEAC